MSGGENGAKPRRIAVAVVERTSGNASQPQVLIGRRPDGVPLAGYWEFPGGKVHQDESFEAAAIRECREETGLDVEVHEQMTEVSFEYEHGVVQLRFFRCALKSDVHPSQPFRWISKSQLAEYRFPEANEMLVRRLVAEATIE